MAMAVGVTEEGEPYSEINTTPLIDVMLVLLIMLIITIPPQTHAVKLDSPRPDPNAIPPENPVEPIAIQVDFDGTFYWNGNAVDRATMEQYMIREAALAEQPEIHIRPHKLAKYREVAAVMASAQRLGLRKIGIIGGTN
ncbi:biopolymer transporter ExbD [bacterium]|nr:biopolymer transporter ExbD [bacterium]